MRVSSRLSTVSTITDISLYRYNDELPRRFHGGAWESHHATLSHRYTSGLHFHGAPPPTMSSKSLSEKSHDGFWQQRALLNAEPGSSTRPPSSPHQTSRYLIWIQDAFNPVLSATHFHIHYILLSFFVFSLYIPGSGTPTTECRLARFFSFFHTITCVTSLESIYVCDTIDDSLGALGGARNRSLFLLFANTVYVLLFLTVWNAVWEPQCNQHF